MDTTHKTQAYRTVYGRDRHPVLQAESIDQRLRPLPRPQRKKAYSTARSHASLWSICDCPWLPFKNMISGRQDEFSCCEARIECLVLGACLNRGCESHSPSTLRHEGLWRNGRSRWSGGLSEKGARCRTQTRCYPGTRGCAKSYLSRVDTLLQGATGYRESRA